MNVKQAARLQRTVGVEEELLLVDQRSGRPLAAIESLLAAAQLNPAEGSQSSAARPDPPHLEREVKQEQVEVISPPCATTDELASAIVTGRRMADDAAQRVGARAVALATSVLPVDTHLSRSSRYQEIQALFGLTLKEQLTCGFHVHVGITSEDEGVAVLDRVRQWLPTLLAMSCNSPIWMGQDTEYSSYRYQVWNRWPSAGPYDIFGSAGEYRRTVRSMVDTGVLLDYGMVYFDARLCEHFPTVEVRVADVCMEAEHAVAIAAIVRALVETAVQQWRNGGLPEPVPTALLRLASWSGSRFGVDGILLNPLLGTPCPARVAVRALLAHVQPALVSSGDHLRVESAVDQILAEGTGARRQRQTLHRTKSKRAVVDEGIEITHRAGASMLFTNELEEERSD